MGSLTIRNLDDELKQELRVRGARRGTSMEDEARSILRAVVGAGISLEGISAADATKRSEGESAWDLIQRLRKKHGTLDLNTPGRTDVAASHSIFDE